MSRIQDVQRVLDSGIVAIIRSPSGDQLVQVAEALADGGVDVIEITLTVPKALDVISKVRDRVGDRILLGAGTILDEATARSAILAGAEFLVTPVVRPAVIETGHRYDKTVMCGAFTPTEILTAWEAGAEFIKVFPAEVGGPGYLKAVHGPFPYIRLLPTGGVNLETLGDFVRSGASAVGLGGNLVTKEALAKGDMAAIRAMAEKYVTQMKAVRGDRN